MGKDSKYTKRKWWYRWIRALSWFSFRYWWFVWLLFLVALFLFWFFCWKTDKQTPCDSSKINNQIEKIRDDLDNCCGCISEEIEEEEEEEVEEEIDTIQQAPTENCRVHFSGAFMGGIFKERFISKIYKVDQYSEYVGSGFYPNNKQAFPKAVLNSFDGIAIDKNTRLIIYQKKNFEGDILLDITGPAIINNVKHKNNPEVNFCNSIDFSGDLQINYPQSVRFWSNSDMENWSNGSCKIICN